MKAWITMAWLVGFVLFVPVGCRPKPPAIGIHQAVIKGDARAVQQHIAAGTDLRSRDANGWTALHLAAMRGDLPMVRILRAAGADPNQAAQNGKTPLDLAREYGRVPVAAYLQDQPEKKTGGGRGLVDGGLGVSGVLDSQ